MEGAETPVVAGGITVLTDAFDTVLECASAVWDFVIANPYLVVFAAAGLVCLGFRMFRKARGIAG